MPSPKDPTGKNPPESNSDQLVAEVIKGWSDEQKQQLAQQVSLKLFSGPLPSPDDLKRYDEAAPGAADRILTVFEKEQQMQADGQAGILDTERRRIDRATLLGLALIGIAGIATWKGAAVIAVPLGLAGVIGTLIRYLLGWLGPRNRN